MRKVVFYYDPNESCQTGEKRVTINCASNDGFTDTYLFQPDYP